MGPRENILARHILQVNMMKYCNCNTLYACATLKITFKAPDAALSKASE